MLALFCCALDKMKEKKKNVAQKREGVEPFRDRGSVSLHCGPKGAENNFASQEIT